MYLIYYKNENYGIGVAKCHELPTDGHGKKIKIEKEYPLNASEFKLSLNELIMWFPYDA